MPVSKSVGQLASFAKKNLSKELKLYAAADALCHRLLTETIMDSINQKWKHSTSNKLPMLTIGTEVIIHFRTRPVAEGIVTFHGIADEQIKWGEEMTLGKNHVKVKISKIIMPSHAPKFREDILWPNDKKNLRELWETVDNLEMVTAPKNLAIKINRSELKDSNVMDIMEKIRKHNTTYIIWKKVILMRYYKARSHLSYMIRKRTQ